MGDISGMEEVLPEGVVLRPVKTVSPYNKVGHGALRIREWSPNERQSRALKRLAICWVLAIFAIAIPPHGVWLVFLGLLGPILAWLASRNAGTVLAQTVTCPDCGAQAPVEEQPQTWPMGARCRQCRNIFSIEKAEAQVAKGA